jgi:hypothetical protein
MANTINNVSEVGSVIAKMSAKMFADKCQFVKAIDKEESLSGEVNGFSKGDTININKPARFTTGTSADITSALQDVTEEKVALTLNTQRVTGISLTSDEIATELSLKSWAKRILDPAVSGLVQETEADVLAAAVNATFNHVGDADGTTVFDTDLMLSAGEKQDFFLCPMDDQRKALLSPTGNRSAVNARKGLFQHSEEIAKQYKKGYMGTADGFDYIRNNLLPTHTNGSDVTGVAVNDASVAEGASTLTVDGASASITVGTVFTIAGVNAVHPITRADLKFLQQFVVTSAGTTEIGISPSLYAAGTRKNVTALPADNAALVFVGAASASMRQNLVFHPSAYRIAFAPLIKPDGVDMIGQETVDGITVRVVRAYSILTDKMIMRLDVLYGHTAVRPEWMCRISE